MRLLRMDLLCLALVALSALLFSVLRLQGRQASAATGTDTPTATNSPSPTNTPTPTPTWAPGLRATFSVSPGGTHALNESFTVQVTLSDVTFCCGYGSWAGFDLELDYDGAVVRAVSAAPGLCLSPEWRVPSLGPAVVAGCMAADVSATSGTLAEITFVCIGSGTSGLEVPSRSNARIGLGNALFTRLGDDFQMTLNNSTTVGDRNLPTATPTSTPTATFTPVFSPTATATPAGPADTADLAARAPSGAEPFGRQFVATVNLSKFTPGTILFWAGYDFELAYDTTRLAVNQVSPGLCPRSDWGNPSNSPVVLTGCFALQSTSNGILENITFECLTNGPALQHIAPQFDPASGAFGTGLFDFTGSLYFSLTLRDATVTCDQNAPFVPDDDGDGCESVQEVPLALDPFDPWDFFSVPVPALLGAPDPHGILKDKMVMADDAQAVFAYYRANARAGTPAYEQDLNGNGVKDGLEYDRSVLGAGHSGPPDGAVAPQDAQLAFAQFKLNYRC